MIKMKIEDYLKETEYASQNLLNIIWDDFERANDLKNEIQKETPMVHNEYNRAIAMQMYSEDPDDIMLGVGMYWDNYFGADKDLYQKNEKLNSLISMLAARELSLTTLSGNLLDNAKKGLSIVYGKPTSWPQGRIIGNQALSNIILQSRNQSAHIDEAIREGNYKNPNIIACFTDLQLVNNVFSEYKKRDMSFEIIKELGWTKIESFNNDIYNIK